MEKIIYNGEHFNILDTLTCGQIFRFKEFQKGFLVFSKDKCAYCYNEDGKAIIECEEGDKDYFWNFFDLDFDYKSAFEFAKNCKYEIVNKSAELSLGIRILNQDKFENLFSFIVSQNNNIPRIKSILEKICEKFGSKKCFLGEYFYTFPTISNLSSVDEQELKNLGLGYRAKYIYNLINLLNNQLNLEDLSVLTSEKLKCELLNILGVGNKVCDCVMLFSYHKTDSFPVDTWIEKVYKENFNGKLTDRNKISKFFTDTFGEFSGIIQQYLFHYKRNLEE